ncbi:MAG TPA: hypothetical protein EYQ50_18025 [Verrucomicrobiales bacterium]|nr:hypothetical protein [Verrucomicrobiales bacterium]
MPKSPFRLEIPESVQLSDSLIEKSLCLFTSSGNGEIDFARTLHEISFLARPFIERFAMIGMTGKDFGPGRGVSRTSLRLGLGNPGRGSSNTINQKNKKVSVTIHG